MRADTFQVNALSLAVHVVGEGRPMLWQHGLCGDAGQTAEGFPDGIGWQGMTLECRGHGASDPGPLEALSLAAFAEDLAALAQDRFEPPMVLGGISMGAALALRLAVRRPDLVAGLVLARPAWACDAAPPNLAPYALVGDLLGRLPPDEARAAFEASDEARQLSEEAPDNLASLRGFFGRRPLDVTAALLSRVARDGPGVTPADLARLSVPTLVIGHGRDLAHPWEMAEALAALIPDARLRRITPKAHDRARHAADLREALASFLKEIP